jgi:hypothetical protein
MKHSVYVAQLDRASAYEAGDCGFESRRGLYCIDSRVHAVSYPPTAPIYITTLHHRHSSSPVAVHRSWPEPSKWRTKRIERVQRRRVHPTILATVGSAKSLTPGMNHDNRFATPLRLIEFLTVFLEGVR